MCREKCPDKTCLADKVRTVVTSLILILVLQQVPIIDIADHLFQVERMDVVRVRDGRRQTVIDEMNRHAYDREMGELDGGLGDHRSGHKGLSFQERRVVDVIGVEHIVIDVHNLKRNERSVKDD